MQRIKIIQQLIWQIGRGLLFIPFTLFVGIPAAILMRLFPSLRRRLQSFVRFSSPLVGDTGDEESEFLRQALQAVTQDPRPQAVHSLLQQNIEYLDETFGKQLQTRAAEAFATADRADLPDLAAAVVNLCNRIQELKTGDRDAQLKIAIQGYQTALTVYTQTEFPQQWAMTQYNLGNAFRETGASEAAIAAYNYALEVFNQPKYSSQQQVVQGCLDRLALEREKAIAADSSVRVF